MKVVSIINQLEAKIKVKLKELADKEPHDYIDTSDLTSCVYFTEEFEIDGYVIGVDGRVDYDITGESATNDQPEEIEIADEGAFYGCIEVYDDMGELLQEDAKYSLLI